MEFKHIMFITVLLCSGWAIVVSGLTSINDLGTTFTTNTELTQTHSREEKTRSYFDGIPVPTVNDSPAARTKFGEPPIVDEFSGIIDVLNLGIPLAFVAVIMLILTYKANPIGIVGLSLAICLFYVSSSRANRAAEIVQLKTEFSIDARVWWK